MNGKTEELDDSYKCITHSLKKINVPCPKKEISYL